MSMTLEHSILIDRFAFWKVALLEILLGGLAFLPLTPGFGEGLTFGSFFYGPVGFPMLVIACIGLGLLFAIILPIFFCAVLGRPAIEITASTLTMFSLPPRQIATLDIRQVSEPRFGTARIKLSRAKEISVPIFFYRDGDNVLRSLKSLAANNQR